MAILLPVVSALASVWLFRLAFSERVSQYPSPLLGRAAGIGMGLGSLAIAVTASVTIAVEGQLNSDWQLRLIYGVSGLFAAFMCVATGLYVFALAPGAYERQHPQRASEFGSRGTAVIGWAAGVILIALGLVAGVVAAYLVVAVPGQ